MTKYQELEEKIKEMQAEVDRLKQEEKDNQLPIRFVYESAKKVLSGDKDAVDDMCIWDSTPQGQDHWEAIYEERKDLTDKDIIQIQKWCILYLEEKNK
jgi:sugar-specific transcriptional regulator TrmB